MLVDSCSFELICVLVDQYVIQYFLVSQYLHSFVSPFQFYFSTITEQEGQVARLRKYQGIFSRRLPHSKSHSWNLSPAPLLHIPNTWRREGWRWGVVGDTSLDQGHSYSLESRTQGNRCCLNPCLARDLHEHCCISRQNIKNLSPACLKHDLQKGVCSPTWYFSCFSDFYFFSPENVVLL